MGGGFAGEDVVHVMLLEQPAQRVMTMQIIHQYGNHPGGQTALRSA